jgi:ATP-dependent DNA helicase DinG
MADVHVLNTTLTRNRDIKKYFAPNGILAQHLPGFLARPQQLQAATAVMTAMDGQGGLALVEAATGVGKTLAYLIPAMLSASPKRKVVISTHSLALQAQLVERDIPFVTTLFAEAEGVATKHVEAAVLKGRGNYLCLQDYDVARGELWTVGDRQFEEIGQWAKTTSTGDVVELPFSYQGWIDIRANADTCKAKECRYFDRCFYYGARQSAADASIIIVNHALFFSDLAMRQSGEEGTIIPDYEFVVFDEAHHLESAAAGAFGIACASSRVTSLVDKIRRLSRHLDIDRDRLKLIDSANDAIFAPLTASGRSEFMLDDSLPGFDMRAARANVAQLGTLLDSISTELLKADHGGNPAIKDRIDGLRRLCTRTKEELTLIFTGEDHNFLRWGSVNRTTRRGPTTTVNWTPICVAPILEKALWTPPRTIGAALISATLATDGGFAYLKQRLGIDGTHKNVFSPPDENPFHAAPGAMPIALDGHADAVPPAISGPYTQRGGVGSDPDIVELLVGSPFDYATQAMLYVPQRIPPPGDDPGYLYALVNDILALIDASNGGAFLLFTSYRALNLAHEKLIASELPYTILRQGDMPNARLVDAFKQAPNSVLLGTQSFWEGVDIPGHSLRLVVIDKLPFATPDNPLHKARVQQITESGGDWFNDYALPQAQLKLKQGFGRLIRTSTDHGVVALMDSRLRTKGYGRRIISALPPAPLTGSIDDVKAFYAASPIMVEQNTVSVIT